jgi:hypothetical protein
LTEVFLTVHVWQGPHIAHKQVWQLTSSRTCDEEGGGAQQTLDGAAGALAQVSRRTNARGVEEHSAIQQADVDTAEAGRLGGQFQRLIRVLAGRLVGSASL